MSDDIRAMLAREADEAEAVAEAEDRGERPLAPRHRRSGPQEASQVYSVRLPREAIEQLRAVAESLGEAPTALLRRFVMERLAQEQAPSFALSFPVPGTGVFVEVGNIAHSRGVARTMASQPAVQSHVTYPDLQTA
ncbi:MAG: hypothetical protein ACTHOD_07620 [Motilibacteraceae bacterium]